MMQSESDQYLELYKLHAELADRVSQRREGANRLFVGLVVALLVFVGTLIRFGAGVGLEAAIIFAVGFCGAALCVSWVIVIQSYRQLNRAKFRVLHNLEQLLPFQFFTDEWDPQAEGQKSNRYWRLTHVELGLPLVFGTLFLGVMIYSICSPP